MTKWHYISFLLLLSFYLLICVFSAHRPLENDECRYLSYATNLTEGYYTPAETKMLWNGPGYPVFVSVFVLLKLPIVAAKYCNAFFLFFSVLFLYRTLCFYTPPAKAWICAVLFGLYPPLLPELPRLLTEPLTVFLISGFLYFLVKSFREKNFAALCIAGVFGGYLILTKVIFAYVVLAALISALMMGLWKHEYMKAAFIYLVCLVVCLPYLIYTYSLTGKFFYWGNSGGSVLYCMTNPSPNEWGVWVSEKDVYEDDRYAHHRPFFDTLKGKDYVEQDRLYKEEAIENLRRYPVRYAYNWISNCGRLWMNYPYAFKEQRPHTLFYMFPNSLLLAALIFSLFPLVKAMRRLPAEIVLVSFFSLFFLLGSSLLYCCSRYLVSIVPALLLLIGYCWTSLLHIQFRDRDSTG